MVFGEQCQELNEGRIGGEAAKRGRRQGDMVFLGLQPSERPIESCGRARQ